MTEVAGRREAAIVQPSAPGQGWPGVMIPLASVLGMVVSGYLTWVHGGGSTAWCTGGGDCAAVSSSA